MNQLTEILSPGNKEFLRAVTTDLIVTAGIDYSLMKDFSASPGRLSPPTKKFRGILISCRRKLPSPEFDFGSLDSVYFVCR